MANFLPEFFNEGDRGPAVSLLHTILSVDGFGSELVFDGIYGPATRKAVAEFQYWLGLRGDDVDGLFGPATRAAYLKNAGFDVNSIPAEAFAPVSSDAQPAHSELETDPAVAADIFLDSIPRDELTSPTSTHVEEQEQSGGSVHNVPEAVMEQQG